MSFSEFLSKVSGAGKSSPAPAPTNGPAQAPDVTSAAGAAPASSVAVQAPTAAPAPEPSGLDQWAQFFATKAPEPVAAAPGIQSSADLFNLDVKGLAKAAEGINMSQVVPRELMAKALGGDTDAMYEALNKSAQVTFMMGLQAAMQSVKPAMESRMAEFGKQVPDTFRKLSVDQTVQSDPLLSHPALQPVVSSMRAEIERKHPDATPQQVQQAITAYFKTTGISIAPAGGSADTSTKKPATGVDWDTFL